MIWGRRKMELKGRIIQMLDSNYGYILGEDDQLYLFSIVDIMGSVADFSLLNRKVLFKPVLNMILQATFISLL